jgi:hypothetical protein
VREQIEQKLADYRQGLAWMEQKREEMVQALQTLDVALVKQQGAIEGLEGILGAGEDTGTEGDDAGGPGRVDN